ncbi:GNAT family N-acetyltransferase [Amphibacillus indicireducens]|uniref:GNAT family N-acetyltransferase n=1 Tax=Amphibacillus indicireducens TaxID=1076330 RepID=A0ABP7V1N7_9BACI
MIMNVIEAISIEAQQDAFGVRDRVFIVEQGVAPEIEHDQYDLDAIHFVGYLDGQAIAAARVRLINGAGKIQRVAILQAYRQRGHGKQLMLAIESILADRKVERFYLNAQTHAVTFYQALGYQVCSEPFYEAGIEHVTMEK